MARKKVVQITCDRCKRGELLEDDPNKEGPDFTCTLLGTTIDYPDLCSSCRSTMRNLMDQMNEWKRDIKPKLGPADKAAPLNVAPDYTPHRPFTKK